MEIIFYVLHELNIILGRGHTLLRYEKDIDVTRKTRIPQRFTCAVLLFVLVFGKGLTPKREAPCGLLLYKSSVRCHMKEKKWT